MIKTACFWRETDNLYKKESLQHKEIIFLKIAASWEGGQEESAAARPQEEKTLKEEGGKEMPEAKDRKPSFLMMDGKAVLEYDGFHMEVSVDVSNSGDIKGKIDLLYSSLERFTAIAGGN